MENAVLLTNDFPTDPANTRRGAVKRAISFSGLILLITVGLCAGLYQYEKQALQERTARFANDDSPPARAMRAALLQGVDDFALNVTAMAILGGLGSLRSMLPPQPERRMIAGLGSLRTPKRRPRGSREWFQRSSVREKKC